MEFAANPALIGQRIKALRQKRRETMTALGGAVGVAPRNVYGWEYGEHAPGYWALVALAQHYGVSIDYLAGLTADPY